MSSQPILTDADLEAMLARRAGPRAPLGLAEVIEAAVAEAPDGRRPWWSFLAPPRTATPALRFAWLIASVGLLLAATVSAVLVGSELLRRQNQLTVVPPPTTIPVPTTAPVPSSAPVAIATRPIDQVNDLAFAADGSPWLATGAGVVHLSLDMGSGTLFEQSAGLPTTDVYRVAVSPDGTVWAGGGTWVAHFDGAWTAYTVTGEPGGLPATGDLGGLVVGDDGALLLAARDDGGAARLLRFDGAWTSTVVPEAIAGPASPWAGRLVVGPDGAVWAAMWAASVATFDGTSWTAYSKESAGLPRGPWLAGVTPDGAAWVELEAEGCVATGRGSATCTGPAAGVARFDGARWTVYTTTDGLADDDALLSIGSDGTVWATYASVAGAVSRFDGQRWVTTQVPALEGTRALGAAPDGALWLGSPGSLLRYDGTSVTRHPLPPFETKKYLPPLVLEPTPGQAVTTTPSALGTITWHIFDPPAGRYIWAATGTAHAPVAIDGPDLRWLDVDGTWAGVTLPITPWRATAVGDDVIAHGQGAVRLRWDGTRWAVDETLVLPATLSFVERVVAGPRGTVLTGGTSVAFSRDGSRFSPASRPPEPAVLGADSTDSQDVVGCSVGTGSWPGTGSIGPVLATDAGFVALTAANPANWNNSPLCEPVPWFSEDGSTWTLISRETPFGEGAVVVDVASRDGRHVAVGAVGTGGEIGSPASWAAWVSDDGLTWERLPTLERPEPSETVDGVTFWADVLGDVAADASGWVIVAWEGAAWTSADGRTWEPLRGWPGIRGGYMQPSVALSPGMIVAAGSLPGPWHDAVAVGTIEP